MKKTRAGLLLVLSAMGLASQGVAHAGNGTELDFSGTLTANCSINSGNKIDVPFGTDVDIGSIDGTTYDAQDIALKLSSACGERSISLTLNTDAKATSWDAGAFSTTKDNLGVKLFLNGTALPINKATSVSDPKSVKLKAVLSKNASKEPTPGAFTAVATLLATYS